MANILENPIFSEAILPFLLVFVVVFAILQKSKILGEGKQQIDALASLAIALLLIAVPQPRQLIVGLMPWLAVGIVVLLIYFLLYGFVVGDLTKDGSIPKWMKNAFAGIAAVFTVGIILYVSGLWKILIDWASGGSNDSVWMSVIMLILIVGVIAVVINSVKKDK